MDAVNTLHNKREDQIHSEKKEINGNACALIVAKIAASTNRTIEKGNERQTN